MLAAFIGWDSATKGLNITVGANVSALASKLTSVALQVATLGLGLPANLMAYGLSADAVKLLAAVKDSVNDFHSFLTSGAPRSPAAMAAALGNLVAGIFNVEGGALGFADKIKPLAGELGSFASKLGLVGDIVSTLSEFVNAYNSNQAALGAAATGLEVYGIALKRMHQLEHAYHQANVNCSNCPPPGGVHPSDPSFPLPGGGFTSHRIGSHDPNEIIGPAGAGSAQFVAENAVLPYTIGFENTPSATAPAQTVTVTEHLDPSLDASTFQLGSISFGAIDVAVPSASTSFSTRVDARATLGLFVDVTASFNASTMTAVWTFTSIDPTTLDAPADPHAGFLPPDDASGSGEGFVSYTIAPKASDATGTTLTAQAVVVFDTNAPISTAPFVNTIDAGPPTSQVNPLPATTTSTSFSVSWSGSDGAGSGIASYDVYVSTDGGPFAPFVTQTPATSAVFNGAIGHSYAFYSVATDNVGHVQQSPANAQTSIAVVLPPPVTMSSVQEVLNKKHQLTGLIVSFTGAVNSGEAGNLNTYRLATAGKKGSFTAKNATVIKLKSAIYSAASGRVTLTFKKPAMLTKVIQLLVHGSGPFGLKDSSGRFIDGDHNGGPGGDAIALIRKGSAKVSARLSPSSARVSRRNRNRRSVRAR